MKVYTIKEIAKLAKVSAGTVDRVLHERGKVSAEKEEKVKSILKRIDYRPNLVARSLKLNKQYRLVVMLPDYQLDAYWKPCFIGIDELKKSLLEVGVFVEVLKYDPNNSDDFTKTSERCFSLDPDGVLLGALFLVESRSFLQSLALQNIPFNLINTPVSGVDYLTYVGQDLMQTGRAAAHLFELILTGQKSLLIVHIAEDFENAFHMQEKERGFRSYFEGREGVKIETLNIKTNKFEESICQLKSNTYGDIDGIFVTTSKAHMLARSEVNIPIIGYDLLEENVKYLINGDIRFLIYQNPKMQAAQGISMLADHLAKNKEVPDKKFLPIEIVGPENVGSYQELQKLRAVPTEL